MSAIDNPPAQPSSASYPLSALAIYPVVTSSPSYDPTKKTKNWTRAIQAGENPNSYMLFNYFDENGNFVQSGLAMSIGDAAAVNVAPPNVSAGVSGIVPAPSRPLFPNEKIVSVLPGAFEVVRTDVSVPAQETSVEQQILDGVNAIRTHLGI